MMREPYPPSVVNVRDINLKPFSRVFGRNFKFPRAAMYFLLLVECAFKNLSMEAVCDASNKSSDRYFFCLKSMSVDEISGYCNVLLKHVFKILWMDRGLHHPVFLAIDTTDISCSANNPEFRHYNVKNRGLKVHKLQVIRFATISIVMKNFKLTLAVLPVRRGEKLETTVEKLLLLIPSGLTVRAILMDKGFYHTGIFRTVEQYGYKYVIPVKRYDEMNWQYHIAEVVGVWRFRYTMNKNRDNEYTFNVYLQDVGVEYYIGFTSNMDMTGRDFDTLSQAYKYRWNIEVGYKESLEYRIKTSTRNHGHRVITFTISHLMMNIQSIINKENPVDNLTIYHMKLYVFPCLHKLRHGTRPMGKRFILIY